MRRKIKSCCFPSCRPPAGKRRARSRLCLLMAAILLLTACGRRKGQEDSLRIGVALYTQDDTFISAMTQDLELLAQEAERSTGRTITLFISDGKSNQTTQMYQLDRI